MISGLIKTELKIFSDNRGKVMHMMRNDSPIFEKFGEIYFSWINPGVIKGWKLHKEMTMNFAVPSGDIKLVLCDNRKNSPTYGMIDEICIGESSYNLITIPSNIWYGFKALNEKPAMIANCASIPHKPEESINIPISDESIPYVW